jgi:hypothetical protein
LKIKVSTRNAAGDRDVAVILIDQLKEIHIDGELELIETANWFPKVMRKPLGTNRYVFDGLDQLHDERKSVRAGGSHVGTLLVVQPANAYRRCRRVP